MSKSVLCLLISGILLFASYHVPAQMVSHGGAYAISTVGHGHEQIKTEMNFSDVVAYSLAHPAPLVIQEPENDEDDNERPARPAVTDHSLIHYRALLPGSAPHGAYLPGPPLLPSSPAPTDTFEAVLDPGTVIPPDTHGAVDSNYCVTAINSNVRIQTRAGVTVSTVSLDAFWNPIVGAGSYDPRIHYDATSNRWIFITDWGAQSATSSILIAVSKTSNPTGAWWMYKVLVDATGTDWMDYPQVGFNGKWVTVTGNMFSVASNAYDNAKVFVFNKANLASGAGAAYTSFVQASSFAIAPAITYDVAEQNMFMVESWDGSAGGGGQTQLWKIAGAIGSETMTSVGFPASAGFNWQGQASGGGGDFVPQLGTASLIQANDDRITQMVQMNNKLWFAHPVFLPATGTTTRVSIQWWQMDTLGTPAQIGLIDDPSATNNNFYSFPTLAVNSSNDALIGFTRTSKLIHPSTAYALHMHTDPVDSMRPVYTYRHGLNTYFKNFGGTRDRWGDYSATCLDPLNSTDFWTIQECSAAATNTWDTWWAYVKVCVPPPATITATSTTGCLPLGVTLNANTGTGLTYQWELAGAAIAGATTSTYNATVTGTYNVIVYNSSTCDSVSLPVVVTISGSVPPITGTYSVCANSTTQLTDATGGGTWISSSPADASVGISSGLVTSGGDLTVTTVTITYTAPSGCATTAVVTVYPLPSASITPAGSTTFCTGGSVVLNANTGAGYTYQWQLGGSPISGATLSSYTATLGGSYTVIVRNVQGCGVTSSVMTVTVGTPPGATITPAGPTTFCTGGSVVLNANTGAGYTYQWQLGGVNIGGATTSSYTATLGGNYTVIVSSTGCNSTSAITTVTITAGPGATITPAGPTTFCAPGTVVLNANTGAGITYQWLVGGANISGATLSSYTAAASGGYAVIVTQGPCVVTSATTTVTVTSPPTATITPAGLTTFCSGGSVVLNANTGAGYTYQWQLGGSNIAGATASSYTATLGGNYTVIITAGGCSGTSAVTTVTVVTSPGATITPAGPTTFCSPGSVVLNANTGAGLTYQWQLTGVNIPGATLSSYTASVSGDYDVVVTSGPCVITSAITTVTVISLPTVTAITGATNVCVGQTIPLTDATAGGVWSSGSAAVATVDGSGNVSGATAGTVNISYTLSNACGATSATYTITVNAATVLSAISGITDICVGQTSPLSDAVAGGVWASTTPAVASISAGGVVSGLSVGTSTISYTYTNASGCVSNAVTTVNIVSAFTASITPASSTTFCTGGYVGLNATLGAGYTYQWQLGGANIAGATSSTYIASLGGNYTVIITNATGCFSTSGGVLVTVNPSPIVVPSVGIIGSLGTVLCAPASAETFTAIPTNGGTTPGYQWYVNGVAAGTGATYGYTPASGDVVTVVLTSNNICAFPDTALNSITISVIPLVTPSVSITSIHNDSTCSGDTVQFIAVPVYGGTAPTYLWTENGTNVATGPYYIYPPHNGDTLILTMTSNYPCLTTNLAVSDIFIMHTFTPIANNLSVSVSQSSVMAGSVDTFTAMATGAGTTPTFQWYIDGTAVTGATSNIYITDSLKQGQVVNCEETSSFICSEPRIVTSGGISVNVIADGVLNTGNGINTFTLLPNPNAGTFSIQGTLRSGANDKVNIVITDMLGRAIYKRTAFAKNGSINEHMSLDKSVPAGMYIVSVTAGEVHTVFHVVIDK